MADYMLTCESTADYPRSFFEQRDIPFACFHYVIDGTSHPDDLYASCDPHEFFSRIKAGAQPKTSQVTVGEYLALWEPFLAAGKDIVHVSLSSGISGSYGSAVTAAREVAERYPQRAVHVIDSLGASAGYGLLVEYMADRRDTGATAEELVAWAEAHRLNVNHWFYVGDLECLKRGGRVSSTSALIGSALKICPVLDVNCDGKLIPRKKIRTKRRAGQELVRIMMERVDDGAAYAGRCVISQSDCREDAQAVADAIVERMPQLAGKIAIHDIGTVIGSHTGPGTVALFFMGAKRVN